MNRLFGTTLLGLATLALVATTPAQAAPEDQWTIITPAYVGWDAPYYGSYYPGYSYDYGYGYGYSAPRYHHHPHYHRHWR